MQKLKSKKETNEIIKVLENCYPDAKCGLDYISPLYLAIALILAAQCTDKRVNMIMPVFFNKFPTLEDISNAKIEDIEKVIKPCGFYKNKAKNISLMSKKLIENFSSEIPNTMKDLTSLPGIGRKSANIILQECFNKSEGIAVDTHVSRTTYRIGFTLSKEPLKQEQELIKKVDKKYFNKINHILVYHGRKICDARKPKCDICPINEMCNKNGIKIKK